MGKNIFLRESRIENGERYFKLKEKNFDVVYLHEEGAVFPGAETDWIEIMQSQYDPSVFDCRDKVCVWGEFQRAVDEGRSPKAEVCLTGHPRFDLYKKENTKYFEYEKKLIQNKYGNFVLINGNYSIANHGLGIEHVIPSIEIENSSTRDNHLKLVERLCYYSRQLYHMIELTCQLASDYPRLNFVYRPHPSENKFIYEVIFKDIANIFVDDRGGVAPWILAAKAVIHDGCTTAIEAYIAERLVINYKPVADEIKDIWLPNKMGLVASNYQEVKRHIDAGIDYSLIIQLPERAKNLLYNLEGNSFDALKNVISEVANNRSNQEALSENQPSAAEIKYAFMRKKLRSAIPVSVKKRADRLYHERKFPGFTREIVMEKTYYAEKVLKKKVNLAFYNHLMFCIYVPK